MRLILDTHCHTVASGHAYSTIKEYVDEAAKKGLELISITDHVSSMPGAPESIYFLSLVHLQNELNGVEILKGAEVNIINKAGKVDLKNGVLKKLDIVIASMHTTCFPPLSRKENTQAVLNVMDNPYIHIIGHLGDPNYPIYIEEIVCKAKKEGVIIEINNASMNPTGVRSGSDDNIYEILKCCVKHDVSVSVGSDAHFYTGIGEFGFVQGMLEKANVPEKLVLNTSKEKLKGALTKRRSIIDEYTGKA